MFMATKLKVTLTEVTLVLYSEASSFINLFSLRQDFIIFFVVIGLKKVWKFGYLVFFARIKFCEFVLAKNFAELIFAKLPKILKVFLQNASS